MGRHFPDIGWAALRTGWEASDYTIALKSSFYGGGHCHEDQNHFVFGGDSIWMINDRGYKKKPAYHHNVILVDGDTTQNFQVHNYDEGGVIEQFYVSGSYGYVVGNASRCYDSLSKWRRKIVLVNESSPFFVIKDEIASADSTKHHIDWLLHTWGDVVESDSVINIAVMEESLDVEILLPENVSCTTVVDPADSVKYGNEWHYWHQIEVSTDSAVNVDFLSAFLPRGSAPNPLAAEIVNGTSMVGARVFGDSAQAIVMFSTEGDTASKIEMVEYVFTCSTSSAITNILVDTVPDSTYWILDQNLTTWEACLQETTATSEGSMGFEIDPATAGTESHRVLVVAKYLQARNVNLTAYNQARKYVYECTSDTVWMHVLHQGDGVLIHDSRQATPPFTYKIFPWTSEPVGRGITPAVSGDTSGPFYAVALDTAGKDKLIFATMSMADGGSCQAWTPFAAVDSAADDSTWEFSPPAIAVGSLYAHVAWEALQTPGGGAPGCYYRLMYGRINLDTFPPESLESVDTLDSFAASASQQLFLTGPSVAVDARANPHIVWYRPFGSDSCQILYREYDGIVWAPAETLSVPSAQGKSRNPSIDCNPLHPVGGSIHVVWEHEDSASVSVKHRWRACGAGWDSIVGSPSSGGYVSRHPEMDDFICVWSERDSGATSSEIAYSKWKGTRWSSMDTLSSSGSDSCRYPHVVCRRIENPAFGHYDIYGCWTQGNAPGTYQVGCNDTSIAIEDFSGHITEDTTWQSGDMVFMSGDLWVDPGVTLTIEPLVSVFVYPNSDDQKSGADTLLSELIVMGELETKGTKAEPIGFTSFSDVPQPGDWYGIRVTAAPLTEGGAEDPSEGVQTAIAEPPSDISRAVPVTPHLPRSVQASAAVSPGPGSQAGKACQSGPTPSPVRGDEAGPQGLAQSVISQEMKGTHLSYARFGIVSEGNRSLEIRESQIRHSEASAVKSSGGSVEIKNCVLSDNEEGLHLMGGGSVEYNDIKNNTTGMYFTSTSAPVVKHNTITGNADYGVYVDGSANPNLGDSTAPGHNRIHGNGLFDAYNNTPDTVLALYNYWGTMVPESIEAHIWDNSDDSTKGPVLFVPLWNGSGSSVSGGGAQTAVRCAQPRRLRVCPGSPNPFTGECPVTITLELPHELPVHLAIYNTAGRRVRSLCDRALPPGIHHLVWDGISGEGVALPSGVYFYRVVAGELRHSGKVILLR